MFRIGDKIVCVDSTPPASSLYWPTVQFPILNEIYTIRGFIDTGSIYLEEIINKMAWLEGRIAEVSFKARRFRKVTDISIFQEIDRKVMVDA